MDRVTIGKRIKELRESKSMTQEELSKVLNCARNTLTSYETGERGINCEVLVLLSEYFGVSCDYLLRGIDAENLDVQKATGLSNKAIGILNDAKEHGFFSEAKELSEYFSFLRDDNPVGRFLSTLIESQCFGDVIHDYIEYETNLEKCNSLHRLNEAKCKSSLTYYDAIGTSEEQEKKKLKYSRIVLVESISKCFDIDI
jgi:Predicted transcriptional regulators